MPDSRRKTKLVAGRLVASPKHTEMRHEPNRNTTGRGGPFNAQVVDAVWRKGQSVLGYDPNNYRKDACGMWMKKSSCGTEGDFGWEIDHICPVAKGGSDDLSNLQPLHWQNNRGKSDNYPNWSCTVKAS